VATKFHPGITMHKITFGSGFIGLLFAAGSALIFVLGFPTLWYFVALAAGLGVVVAIGLKAFDRVRSDRSRPLSILTPPPSESSPSGEKMKGHRPLRAAHLSSA
jgi:hypothetical protein